jgi:hypothetical protein
LRVAAGPQAVNIRGSGRLFIKLFIPRFNFLAKLHTGFFYAESLIVKKAVLGGKNRCYEIYAMILEQTDGIYEMLESQFQLIL